MVAQEQQEQDRPGWLPMQWRGSDDGIVWSAWHPLLRLREHLPTSRFAQARVLVDGEWCTSQVSLWHG